MTSRFPHKKMLPFFKRLEALPKPAWIALSGFLTILIGFIRYLTGPDLALSLFFLFPIFAATWFAGCWAGVLMSFVSALSWLAADILLLTPFKQPYLPILNETFRLIVFLIVTFMLTGFRRALNRQKDLAMTDYLTGVANRRAFIEFASIELSRARRYEYPLSVVSLDLDNFKYVNDHFGHSAGDRLLQIVADTLKRNTRVIDLTARLGGDEFMLLLTRTGHHDAHGIVEKLRHEILDVMRNNHWPVTVSIGVVTFTVVPDNVDVLMQKADALMYAAKADGKNQIKLDGALPHGEPAEVS